jgi:hypothetical protein
MEHPNFETARRSTMRHPFDGINTPAPAPQASRRHWLRTMLASLAGVIGFGAARAAAPPLNVRTVAEPSPEPSTTAAREEGAKATTKALREEAATGALRENGGLTTRALREEGGKVTTKALNEEGAAKPPVKKVTTLALGEEGGA